MKITANTLVLLAIAVVASGCATGRIADLKDCGRFSVGYGPGLSVDAKLGILGHPSLGLGSDTKRIGHGDRFVTGAWEESEVVWPLSCVTPFVACILGGRSPLLALDISVHRKRIIPVPHTADSYYGPVTNGVILHVRSHRYRRPRPDRPDVGTMYSHYELFLLSDPLIHLKNMTDIQVGASLGLVSFRAGVNPLEILDFALGYFSLDIACDDPKRKEKPTIDRTLSTEGAPSAEK